MFFSKKSVFDLKDHLISVQGPLKTVSFDAEFFSLSESIINVETSDLNPRVMCTSKSNKKTGEPS